MIKRPTSRGDLAALLSTARVVAFLSVEWSAYERAGRPVFAALAERLAAQHAGIGVECWVLPEDWEAMPAWFDACKPPVQAATGYGAVVWLEGGRVVAVEEHAARAGVEALILQTLRLWGGVDPTTEGGSPDTRIETPVEG